MLDQIIAAMANMSWSWPTFLVSLGIFVFLLSLINFVGSIIALRKAQRKAKKAKEKLAELQTKLKMKNNELNQVLNKKENK